MKEKIGEKKHEKQNSRNIGMYAVDCRCYYTSRRNHK